jgi:hypothetical protein
VLEYAVRLPFQAVLGELDSGVFIRLGITAEPIMGISALVSLAIYSRNNLSKNTMNRS